MKALGQLLALLVLLFPQNGKTQDMHFSQFYSAPLLLNPAYTGAGTCLRSSLIHRNQWSGFEKPYRSSVVSIDHYLNNAHLGLGALVAEEYAGTGALKTIYIRPSVAFAARIKKESVLRLGLQPGIGIKTVNFNDLLFGDQIYRGGAVPTIETPAGKHTYFDFNAGAILSRSKTWLGIAFNHLNMPNESLTGNIEQHLPILLSLHAGIRLELNREEKDLLQKKYLSPVLHYRRQKNFDQLDFGCYFNKRIFTLGIWYRGMPGIQYFKKTYINQDAVVFVAGIQHERVKFGYSYDRTISALKTVSKGAHEISLSFQVCNPKNRKIHYALISCPKF